MVDLKYRIDRQALGRNINARLEKNDQAYRTTYGEVARKRRQAILAAHPDWPALEADRRFMEWIATYPGREQQYHHGEAKTVIALIREYKNGR